MCEREHISKREPPLLPYRPQHLFLSLLLLLFLFVLAWKSGSNIFSSSFSLLPSFSRSFFSCTLCGNDAKTRGERRRRTFGGPHGRFPTQLRAHHMPPMQTQSLLLYSCVYYIISPPSVCVASMVFSRAAEYNYSHTVHTHTRGRVSATGGRVKAITFHYQ